jgi:hypothetical protein
MAICKVTVASRSWLVDTGDPQGGYCGMTIYGVARTIAIDWPGETVTVESEGESYSVTDRTPTDS